MYEVRNDIKFLRATKEQIVAVIESINSPMVAAASKPLEPAKAFIVGIRNPTGLFSIYIYLHLLQSKECLIYLHDPAEIPMEQYHENEVEALQFVESMGFMVDNLNFRKLSPDQQTDLMEGLPVFREDLEAYARRHDSAEPEVQEDGEVDLGPLAEEIIELNDVAELPDAEPAPPQAVIPKEGIAKIIRLLSTF